MTLSVRLQNRVRVRADESGSASSALQMAADFSTGLFGCFDDTGICFRGWCCLPCLTCQNSAALDGYRNPPCCYPGDAAKNRAQSKMRWGMGEYNCGDCLTVCCCMPCSECQVAREIKRRNPISYTQDGPGAYFAMPAPQAPIQYK